MKSTKSLNRVTSAVALFSLGVLTGCAGFTPSLGISFPIGGLGSVGVSVGADGRVGGSVGVGVGGASVSVGTSGQLPASQKTQETTGKTDLPATKPDMPTSTTDPAAVKN
jgi:hypothetical protein